MKRIALTRITLALGLSALLAGTAITAQAATPSADEAQKIALEAYIYGYSLVTTDVTRVQMSNVPAVEALKAPLNQFVNVKRYPPGDYRGVSAPNADTLYSLAWLDLKEPQVFSHPDMGKRFFLFPMVNLWMTIFNSPGSRTTGQKAGNYLITGPGWKGEVPKGMTHIASATRYMVILGRTYADGTEADYKAANALQAQYKITPLAAWGKLVHAEGAAGQREPRHLDDRRAAGRDPGDEHRGLLQLAEQAHVRRLAGLCSRCAGAGELRQDRLRAVQAVRDGQARPGGAGRAEGSAEDGAREDRSQPRSQHGQAGWKRLVDHRGLGVYGTDYMKRAVVAAFGWPANLQEDAVYPVHAREQHGRQADRRQQDHADLGQG